MQKAGPSWPSAWPPRRPPLSGAGITAQCSTTATPSPICTSRAASSIRARRASRNSARCGCRCRTFCSSPLCRITLVGQRTRRRHSLVACLHRVLRRPLSPCAPLAQPRARRARARLLRAQSQSALPANHGHDRAAVSLRDDLDRGLDGRVARRPTTKLKLPATFSILFHSSAGSMHLAFAQPLRIVERGPPRGAWLANPVAPGQARKFSTPSSRLQVCDRRRARRRHLHALRRLDHRPHRLDRHRPRSASPRRCRQPALAPPSGWPRIAVVAAPLLWFVYNSVCFGDWLYFARGPLLRQAIELRTAAPGPWPLHPGWHNPVGCAALLPQSLGA